MPCSCGAPSISSGTSAGFSVTAAAGEMRLAFQRGETDIYATSNLISLNELIGEGFQPFVQKGRLLSDGSSKKRLEFPKVPLFDELLGAQKPTGVAWQAYVTIAGADDSGRPLQAAKKTPPEIVKVYRDTMARIEKDKEFAAELAKVAWRRRRNALPCRERAGSAPVAQSSTGRQRIRPEHDEEIFESMTSFRHLVTTKPTAVRASAPALTRIWLASSPNTNAAKVFSNWLLSRAGQTQFHKLTRENSLRIDIAIESVVNPLHILDPKREYLFTGLEEHKDRISLTPKPGAPTISGFHVIN